MTDVALGDTALNDYAPTERSGVAYAVPDLETGGPILKMTVSNGMVKSVTAVVFLRPDPGLQICRAIVTR